jgi:hypothetical protein
MFTLQNFMCFFLLLLLQMCLLHFYAIPSKEYLVNSRVNHGLICSGILPSDYKRFANGTGIGIINEENRTTFFKQHKQRIQQECKSSFLHLRLVFTTCPFFTIFVLWRLSLHCLACHSDTSNRRWNESSAIKNTLWLQSVFFALTYLYICYQYRK